MDTFDALKEAMLERYQTSDCAINVSAADLSVIIDRAKKISKQSEAQKRAETNNCGCQYCQSRAEKGLDLHE